MMWVEYAIVNIVRVLAKGVFHEWWEIRTRLFAEFIVVQLKV